MRITDWSSDVCSSDLKWKFSACSPPPLFPDRRRARSKPSIILGEHDREHAPRERCVRWIFRSEFEGGIIIVDLEEDAFAPKIEGAEVRSEEHTSELQSLMRISYAVFCLKKKTRLPTNPDVPHLMNMSPRTQTYAITQ